MLKKESIRDWMKPQIAHSLPGRLRLVVPGLEYIQAERQELARDLAGIPGVKRVRITRRQAASCWSIIPDGWMDPSCWNRRIWSFRNTR